MEKEYEAEHILTEIEVSTVGLVDKGAVPNSSFFLIKRDGGQETMPDTNVDQVTEESLIEKIKTMFVTKDDVEEIVAEVTKVDETVEPEVEEETVTEEPTELPVADESPDGENLVKELGTQVAELLKMQKDNQEVINLLKASNDELKAEIEKARDTADLEKEKREKREYLEKASQFKAFPVAYNELGAKLYSFAKSMTDEDFAWLMDVLKAADTQLEQAGVFNEMGSSIELDDDAPAIQVAKAVADGTDAKEALLSLTAAQQQEMLSQMRGGK